jgi:hypothetical protein
VGKVSEGALKLVTGCVTAVPLSVTMDTPPELALLAMFKLAVKVPAVVAAKLTVVMQLAAAASVVPQVLVWVKLLAFVPVIVIPVMFIPAPPVLLSVTVSGVAVAPADILGNVSAAVLRLATGVGAAVAVPLNATTAMPPVLALFAMFKLAV